jgi:hypothetical protein
MFSKKEFKMSKFVQDLLQEFKVMKECGMRVPKKAFKLAQTQGDELAESMSVSEAADLLIALAG